jgi:hypothetical protein
MAWMPATEETPTAVLASARTPTAKEVRETIWTPTIHDFWGTLLKNSSERRKIHEKDTRRVKVAHFQSDRFW